MVLNRRHQHQLGQNWNTDSPPTCLFFVVFGPWTAKHWKFLDCAWENQLWFTSCIFCRRRHFRGYLRLKCRIYSYTHLSSLNANLIIPMFRVNKYSTLFSWRAPSLIVWSRKVRVVTATRRRSNQEDRRGEGAAAMSVLLFGVSDSQVHQ